MTNILEHRHIISFAQVNWTLKVRGEKNCEGHLNQCKVSRFHYVIQHTKCRLSMTPSAQGTNIARSPPLKKIGDVGNEIQRD